MSLPTDTTQDFDYLYKILVVGDVQVGKSSFVCRYTKNVVENPGPTLAIEYQTKNLVLQNGSIVKAQIWDTSGSERYRAITTNYYRKSAGVLLFFDLTEKSTFESVARWLADICDYGEEETVIMLVGNKKDLIKTDPSKRQVSEEEAKQLAEKHNLLYEETSAKTGENVISAFEHLIEEIYKEQKKNQSNSEGEFVKQLNINFQKVPSLLKVQKENMNSNKTAGCC